MFIEPLPTLNATVADHTIPDYLDRAKDRVISVRDWAYAGSRPADWTGDAADAANHRMTRHADNGNDIILRLSSASVAFRDYIDAVIALHSSLADLTTQRTAVVTAQRAFESSKSSDPRMQSPPYAAIKELELKQKVDYHNEASVTWDAERSSAEQALITALGESLPTTPDHQVGIASDYLTASEAEKAINALQLDPTNPELLAKLDLIIESYGNDAHAWSLLYDQLGPTGAINLVDLLAQQYENPLSSPVQEEALVRAEAIRAGLALATRNWTDTENETFSRALIDAAAEDKSLVPYIAFIFSKPPGDAPALAGAFSLAAANSLYEYETGEPPLLIQSASNTASGTEMFYAAIGANPLIPLPTTGINLSGQVLESLAASPTHALQHLSDAGHSQHWLNESFPFSGNREAVVALWDSALSAPGGVEFPPPPDGPACVPAVAGAQARLLSEFFQDFAMPADITNFADDTATSLGNISARALTFASLTRVDSTGVTDGIVFLGLSEYVGASIPTFSADDLIRIMGPGSDSEAFNAAFDSGFRDHVAAVTQGVDDGKITAAEGLKSTAGASALIDGLNARKSIESGAGVDTATDALGVVLEVATYLKGPPGVLAEGLSILYTVADTTGFIGTAEEGAHQDALVALEERLDLLEKELEAAGYTEAESDNIEAWYSNQHKAILDVP